MKRIWMRVLLAMALLHTAACAQKLSEVVQSLDDRVKLLNQRSQLEQSYVTAAYTEDTYTPAEIQGYDWPRVGRNPTAAAIDALPIDQKIEVLQFALRCFGGLSTGYLNVSKADLAATNGRLQSARYYTREDFPHLTVRSVADYVPAMNALAHQLLALEILPWPFYGEQREAEWDIWNYEYLEELPPPHSGEYVLRQFDPSQAGEYDMETTFPGGDLVNGDPEKFGGFGTSEEVWLSGSYSKSTEHDQNLRFIIKNYTITYFSKIDSSATVPGLTGQTSGTVYIVAKTSKTPVSPLSAPPEWDRTESASKVLGKGVGSVNLTPGIPDVTMTVTWEDSEYEEGGKVAHVAGTETLGWGGSLMKRAIWAVMVPAFTRGVDVPATRNSLEKAAKMAGQAVHVDGSPLLNPAQDLLFGIDLGVGPQGKGGAMLGLSTTSYFPDGFELGYAYPVGNRRFDTVTALRIIGDADDYRVTYETHRDAWGSPPVSGTDSGSLGQRMQMWSQGRLKQVVSRDLLININISSSYTQTLEIYRRNDGAIPDTPPGEVIPSTGLTLLRTLTLEHPGGEPAFDSDQYLKITDSITGNIHEIKLHDDPPPSIPDFYAYNRKVEFITRNGEAELFRSQTEGYFDGRYFIDGPDRLCKTETFVDGQTLGVATPLLILNSPSVDEYLPISWKRAANDRTIRAEGIVSWGGGSPITTQTITDSEQPEQTINLTRNIAGLITKMTRGDWSYEAGVDGTAWKESVKFKGRKVSTAWTEVLDEDRRVRVYTTPDGEVDSRTSSSSDWSEVEYGKPDLDPAYLAGLPRIQRTKGGSGAVFSWSEISGGGVHSQVDSGYLSSDAVSNGSRSVVETNVMGYAVKSMDYLLQGGASLQTSGATAAAETSETATPWHQPLKYTDYTSGLATTFAFDDEKQRISSVTDGFGVKTEVTDVDGLGRLKEYKWAGHTGTLAYNQDSLGSSGTLAIPGRSLSSSSKTDGFGRLLSASSTAGTTTDLTITRTAEKISTELNDGLTGATLNSKSRRKDGSLETVDGDLLAFGGQKGDLLSVDNGLIKSRVRCKDQPSLFSTIWTDAWGRPRKMEEPSPSGGAQTTTWIYGDPGDAIARVEMRKSSGPRFIDEVDLSSSSGITRRSGLDVNRSGSLASGDRYSESVTTIDGTAIKTRTLVTEGMSGTREAVKTLFTPATGVTETTLNGHEETITTTPDFSTRKVTGSSTNGWSKTSDFDELGHPIKVRVTGAGLPTSQFEPTWRADGSLTGMTLSMGGRSMGASFGNDGLLTGATRNGADIFGGHSISGGNVHLTLDGITMQSKLDGTEWSISGPCIVGESHSIDRSGGGFSDTIVPSAGSPTVSHYNAAGMKVAHEYAAGVNTRYGWYPGGMLASSSCARGGAVTYTYSNDGACDLQAKTFPASSSGSSFSYPAVSEIYGRDSAGSINSITDSSGARSLATTNGRLWQTNYLSGPLAGYTVEDGIDGLGRRTAVQVLKGGVPLHTVTYGMNGTSGEISSVNLSGLTVDVSRDGNRLPTGYQWNGGPAQGWDRDPTGRITGASSSITGAAAFAYPEFHPDGRRKKCTTTGGTWVYGYDGAGQLTSAVHPTLGTFLYGFDGIGRRVSYDSGGHHYTAANGSDPLNRLLQVDRPQSKVMRVDVAGGGQVWVNGVAATVTGGRATVTLASPGTAGGWVAWTARGALSGAGESGANPDAVADQSGRVWFPPASETFVHDAAGNRQSGARWDYGWDSSNRLRNARSHSAGGYEEWDVSFDYDSEGRRFRKTVKRYERGILTSHTVTTFVWDGWELLYERQEDALGIPLRERFYAWGPDLGGSPGAAGGAGGLAVIRESIGGTSTDYYPLYDGGGNVTGLARPDGTLAAQYTYGPFGEPIAASGPLAAANPMRFATKYYDAETGLYYFGHRYYDPSTGTWLSREPLGEGESLNLYAYCHNDPINKVDALGLEPVETGGSVVNGIPLINYEDWTAGGLGWLWGGTNKWTQPPDARQLAQYFKQENGAWVETSAAERYDYRNGLSRPAIATKMEEIAPVMNTLEKGGAIIASAPFVVIAASGEFGAGAYVYGSQALGSVWVQTPLAVAGTQAAFEFATDEQFRDETIGAIASDPNGVHATGEFFGAGASGIVKASANTWNLLKPTLGEGIEHLLYRSGGINYVVPPEAPSFMSWWKSTNKIHGNSLEALGPHDVYVIRDAVSGEILHFGETGRGLVIRFAEHQSFFEKKGIEIQAELLKSVEGKAAARRIEGKYIMTYYKIFKSRPPYNFSNH